MYYYNYNLLHLYLCATSIYAKNNKIDSNSIFRRFFLLCANFIVAWFGYLWAKRKIIYEFAANFILRMV